MRIITSGLAGPSSIYAGQDIIPGQRQQQAQTDRPKLIFRAVTPVGLVFVWKSCRTASVVYDLHVEDTRTGAEIERQRLVRASSTPLRHTLFSVDGAAFFHFVEGADEERT